jgi:glycosyltransferase involved in cell wall biosynthesis
MSEPLVSVLICTIREDPRLELTLQSLLQQTYKHFEVIYVDAIKDKRNEKFLKQASIFKHVQDKPWDGLGKKPGIANARNTGILYCSGEIICVTGDNTWIQPTWIERHVKIVKNSYISVSPCYNISESIDGQILARLVKHKEHPNKIYIETDCCGYKRGYEAPVDCRMPGLSDEVFFGNDKFVQVPGGYLHGVSFALSLEKYLTVNGQDENYDKDGYGFEDCDFGVRLSRMGFKLVMDPANWVVSINDDKNPTLNKMFGTSGVENAKLWEATAKGETPIWANHDFNLRKMRENLKCHEK